MRKRMAHSKTVGRLSVAAGEARQAGDLPLQRAGVGLIFVLGLVLAVFWSGDVRTRETGHASTIANFSDDELFGFGSAALTACGSSAAITWDQVSRSVSSPADGTVSPEITRGFAEFAALSKRLGTEAACSTASDAISSRTGAR